VRAQALSLGGTLGRALLEALRALAQRERDNADQGQEQQERL